MTIQKINLGSSPNGEGGDKWREGSNKINANFDDLDERTTLAQETANSKTANAADAHLLSRSNHTDTQPISTISGLQAALDSAASQINIAGNAATATKLATARTIGGVGFDGTKDIDLPVATTSTAGIAKLVNDLTTGGTDKALTAEQGKLLLAMFTGGTNHFKIPNPLLPSKPWIIQTGKVQAPEYTPPSTFLKTNFNFPVSFPNEVNTVVGTLNVGVYNQSWVNYSIEDKTKTGAIFVYASEGGNVAPGLNYIAIGN